MTLAAILLFLSPLIVLGAAAPWADLGVSLILFANAIGVWLAVTPEPAALPAWAHVRTWATRMLATAIAIGPVAFLAAPTLARSRTAWITWIIANGACLLAQIDWARRYFDRIPSSPHRWDARVLLATAGGSITIVLGCFWGIVMWPMPGLAVMTLPAAIVLILSYVAYILLIAALTDEIGRFLRTIH